MEICFCHPVCNKYHNRNCSVFLIWVVVALTGLEIIYQAYIRPVKKTSAEASVIYSSNPSHRLEINGVKESKDILPVFRQFVSETVLLGHNVAFDMKMLKVKEKTTGIKFLNPVIDTLLMSAASKKTYYARLKY